MQNNLVESVYVRKGAGDDLRKKSVAIKDAVNCGMQRKIRVKFCDNVVHPLRDQRCRFVHLGLFLIRVTMNFLPEHTSRVLAIFAHPDDAELSCFGTLARLSSQGAQISEVIVSDGSRGGPADHNGRSIAQVRLEEAQAAFRPINASLSTLGFADGDLDYNRELINSIETINNIIDPTMVISHYANEYSSEHQDHIAVFRAVKNVCFRKSNVKIFLSSEPINLGSDFTPNVFIDITDQFEQKWNAIASHRSQAGRFYMRRPYQEVRSTGWAQRAFPTNQEVVRYCEAFQLEKLLIGAGSDVQTTRGD
ncbi:PIG-L deacetylase family protein [Rhizobium sp. PAMB 3174]